MSDKNKERKNLIKNLRNKFNNDRPKGEILTVMTGKNYDVVDISLPDDFFEQIIVNEVELSEGFQYEKLNTLVQLYLNAIQYYSSVNPEKVKAYQNRLEYLLTQKETLKNLCKLKKEDSKSSKSNPQVRGRAKTKFMIQSKNIKKEDIKNKVNKFIDENKNISENKKNVKNLFDNDFENQNKKWKEKLAQKRSLMNSTRSFLRTSGRKFFNTPGPIARRALNIEHKIEIPKFEKSGKNMPKYGNIDDDSEEDNKSENNGDVDILKLFKDRHNKDDNDKKDSDDERSIIDDNYNDDFLDKIEEVDEENIKCSEKNVIKKIEENAENKKPLKGILKKKDKITDKEKENVNNKKNDNNDNDLNKEKKEEINNEGKKKQEKKEEEKKEEEKNKDENKDEEKKEEKEKMIDSNKNEIKEEKKEEENEEVENDSLAAKNIIKENNEDINKEKNKVLQRKKSIVDENILRDIEPDEEIKKIIEEKMELLNNLKNRNESGEESNPSSSSNLPIVTKKLNMEDIPPIFQETLKVVEKKMKEFINTLNDHFYKETFEDFSFKLKELYDSKYEKYIMINNEYHSNITEKEYLLENEENLTDEKKEEIQNIIDSLKEEQKDQIDKIVDEYNNNIILLINEFKQNSFKKNTSIQLLEEQLKLDIYAFINDAFY